MFYPILTPANVAYGAGQLTSGETPRHWAAETLEKWRMLGIIEGDQAGNLLPDGKLTRAELVTIINRIFGFSSINQAGAQPAVAFNDVSADEWYSDAIQLAVEVGYMQGYTDGTARPNQSVTREECIVLLDRVFMLLASNRIELSFNDRNLIHSFAQEAVQKWSSLGFIQGYEDGSFRATAGITRAELVTMLSRVVPNLITGEGSVMKNQHLTGNVVIQAGSVELHDVVIEGDLYIAEGVALGSILLDNVTITGRLIVQGGEGGITLRNAQLQDIIVVNRQYDVKIIAEGSTVTGTVWVNGSVELDNTASTAGEGNLDQVWLAPGLSSGHNLVFTGVFQQIATNNYIDSLLAGPVATTPVNINIQGKIEKFELNQPFILTLAEQSRLTSLIIGQQARGSSLFGSNTQFGNVDNAASGVSYNKVILAVGNNVIGALTGNTGPYIPPVQIPLKAEAVKGTVSGTTQITANNNVGLHLAVLVSYDGTKQYNIGDRAPTGGTVINPYVSGTNISGVDEEINKFIYVYWLNAEHHIVELQVIELTEEMIAPSGWNLVWQDEFTDPAIDTDKWNFVEQGDGFGNNELQFYTSREDNARIEEGNLVIQAKEEAYNGMNYTSAKLTTEGKASWTYGKYEIRAKLPEGQGLWPAIWMMPEDMELYDTWPASGEIDIMELVGNDMNTVHGTLHYGTPHTSTGNSYQLPNGESFADDFHTFTTEWEPGEIRWYVDGKLFGVQNDWYSLGSGQPTDFTYPAPFDRNFYMQLNVAVGGTWPGSPDASTSFPQQMLVDYVKVYERSAPYAYREASDSRPGQRDQSGNTQGKPPLADGNYIYNGQFNATSNDHAGIEGVTNSSYWSLRVGDNGAAKIVNDQDAMKLSVTSSGNATYSTQLIQHPVPLKMGQRYRLTFDAKASVARNIEVKLSSGGEGGWTDYAVSGFALDSTWNTNQFDFTMQSNTHPTARIEFNVGGATGDVWFDNIKLVEIEAEEESNRDPLANGNYIYNGAFNQGLASLGYWKWVQKGNAEGQATVGKSVAHKEAKLDIESNSQLEELSLQQEHIYLQKPGHYVLSFDAKSSVSRAIEVKLLDSKRNEVYLETGPLQLSSSWSKQQQHFEFDVVECRELTLQFFVGGTPSTVTLDNVRLEKLTVYTVKDPVVLQAEQYTYNQSATLANEGISRFMKLTSAAKLSYMLQFEQTGQYELAFRVRNNAESTISVGEHDIEIANSHGQWQTVYSEPLTIEAGLQLLELVAHNNAGTIDLDWFAIIPEGMSLETEKANNLIRNGSFMDDLNSWEFWTEAGASISNDNAQLRLDISSVGGQSWSILTKQSGIALENGKFYTLSFKARSSAPRTISVGIENSYNARLLNDQQIQLSKQNNVYSFDFEMSAASDLGSLVFQLGNIGQAAAIGQHQVWIDDVQLVESIKVDSIPFTFTQGQQEGTTAIQATPAAGHSFVVITASHSQSVPSKESTVPEVAGAISPYTSGSDIAGVDANQNKHIALYEVDGAGIVTRFAQKILTEQDIKPISVTNPVALLPVQKIEPGNAHSTTQVTAVAGAGNRLVTKVSSTPIATPSIGAIAPTGSTVLNPYVAGSNISGVDSDINRYVALYEVDSNQRVQSFTLLELQSSQVMMKEWHKVWEDEFDGTSINQSNWNFVQGGGGYGNQELQYYTNNTDNARVEDGKLIIQALKENYSGHSYTSAKLESSGKASWTYGKFEVRAKLPIGQGLWPAIWMMPEDMNVYGTWPASGEIDIMEALGHEPGVVHGTLHYGVEHASTGYSYTLPGGQSFADDFHTFTTEWEPGELRFYVDGILFAVQNDWFAIDNNNPDVFTYPAPFDRDFYMQLNVAVGGTWPGKPDASTVFPQQMQVDYVKVYQMDEEDYRTVEYKRPGPRDTSASIGEGRAPLADGNYIYNGDFSVGTDKAPGIAGVDNSAYWTFNNGADFNAAATAAYDNGWMKVNTTNGGSATYAVQLIQRPLTLEMDKTYTLTFKAKASNNRNMEIKLSQGGEGGWTDYGRGIVALTAEPGTYQLTFKMLSNTHHGARLELNMGGATGDVWIDDVVFKEVSEDVVVERNPLADGNYIYNGNFELGTKFMSYWNFYHSAATAATASVNPRVYERSVNVQISDAGQHADEVMLEQRNIPLVEGQWYELKFDAKSEQARNMTVQFKDKLLPQSTAITTHVVALNEQWNSYTYQFQMEQGSTLNGALHFLLGGNAYAVSIDAVSLKQYFPPISLLVEAEGMAVTGDAAIALKNDQSGQYVAFGGLSGQLAGQLQISESGLYMLSMKLSAYQSDRALTVQVGDTTYELDIPNTHGTEKWAVATVALELEAGTYPVIVHGQYVSVDWLELAPQLVQNGQLANNTIDDWTLWVGTEDWAGSARATLSASDQALKVDIQNEGSQFWSVQLNQQPIVLQQGKSYRLTFKASSTLTRDINVAVEIDGGYPQYMLQTVALNDKLTQYTIDFTMDAMSRNDGKLNFILGRISSAVGAHQIVLDDIMLAETRESVPSLNNAVQNLALTGTYSSSSGIAAAAFDGNMSTRWESAQTDSQHIAVDLKKNYMIDHIKLNWEGAYGKGYLIETSLDGSNWTTVFSTSHGDGGVDDIYVTPNEARYVRLTGVERGTPYGYSLYEFAIYPYDATYMQEDLTAPVLQADSTDTFVKQPITISFADDEHYRNSILSVTVNSQLLTRGTDYEIKPGGILLKGHLFPASGEYVITVDALHYEEATMLQSIDRIPPDKNLAIGINASASSGDASAAFDNNPGTRWISDASDPQSITADLGESFELGRIMLYWEGAYGKSYIIEGSLDGLEWAPLFSTTQGDGGVDEILFNATEARYVRLVGSERGTQYSYSLWSFEIYPHDPSGLKLAPVLTPTKTSYTAGDAITLQFTDSPLYVDAITSILLNDEEIMADAVMTSSSISIPATHVPSGDITITIVADGYRDVTVSVHVSPINVALGAQVTASSHSASATVITDGNLQTRWESEHLVDPQWVELELASESVISQLVIYWEAARASKYIVELSSDGMTWQEVAQINSYNGLQDTINFTSTSAKYIRITGTERALPYGYSIYEVQAY